MNTLSYLEEEAIYIIREVVGQFDKPVLLFSGGKDSIVLLHLCQKAFLPAKIPFPLLHIDTGHNLGMNWSNSTKYSSMLEVYKKVSTKEK
jgi:sulfate adenylyltransferase subunit 2